MHLCLPSFPTRRSSDLVMTAWPLVIGPFGNVIVFWKYRVCCPLAGPSAHSQFSPSNVSVSSLVSLSASICSGVFSSRSEEHTSELQSRVDLVCRLLLEK